METVENVVQESVYTFRKLEAPDIFPMFKILSKIGVNQIAEIFGKDSIQKMLATVRGEETMASLTTSLGISVTLEMVNVVLGNLPNCEDDIYEMLASVSNMSVKEIRKLDFATFTEMVIDFIKKDEFKDFIGVVSRLFK